MKTAVEWLRNQLHLNLPLYQDQWAIIEDLMNQAKEMEKDQMERIYYGYNQYNDEHLDFEQYYNETFKSE